MPPPRRVITKEMSGTGTQDICTGAELLTGKAHQDALICNTVRACYVDDSEGPGFASSERLITAVRGIGINNQRRKDSLGTNSTL